MKILLIPNAPRLTARHYCLAKALTVNGHTVEYVMWELPYTLPLTGMLKHIFDAPRAKTYILEGFTMHKFRRLPFFWPIINGWLFKQQLRTLYEKKNAHIIFSESYTNETEVPKDLPFIYDLADDYAGPADVFGSRIYKFAFRLLDVRGVMKRQATNALAVTAVSQILIKYALQYNKIVVKLPNGVDSKIVKVALKNATPVRNPDSMVYATGFGIWSRVIEIMRTVTKLHEDYPNLTLTLLGDGTEVAKIKSYIRENNAMSYIDYKGFISDQEQLFTLINQSAIGINISDKNKWRDASHPMKYMDYTALGKKVLSTDLEEIKFLNFENTVVFSNENDGFENAARNVLSQKSKSNEYAKLREQILYDYDWNVLAEKLTKLAVRCLERRATL